MFSFISRETPFTALIISLSTKKWVLRFDTRHDVTNPLMGWESTDDTMGEVILEFSTKDKAIEYAKNNNILYELIEPKKSDFIIKSYADNFLKD